MVSRLSSLGPDRRRNADDAYAVPRHRHAATDHDAREARTSAAGIPNRIDAVVPRLLPASAKTLRRGKPRPRAASTTHYGASVEAARGIAHLAYVTSRAALFLMPRTWCRLAAEAARIGWTCR